MSLDNYRDLSQLGYGGSAGFQFEFSCVHCHRKWRSAFKPYRRGQMAYVLSRFSSLFGTEAQIASRAGDGLADMGTRGAHEEALAEAMRQAETLYQACPRCHQGVCADCFDTRADACRPCADQGQRQQQAAHACPACGHAESGGRFCSECGFDRASTHKACPACGAMVGRQARYCTDCGHAF
jgi:hypothetical protein